MLGLCLWPSSHVSSLTHSLLLLLLHLFLHFLLLQSSSPFGAESLTHQLVRVDWLNGLLVSGKEQLPVLISQAFQSLLFDFLLLLALQSAAPASLLLLLRHVALQPGQRIRLAVVDAESLSVRFDVLRRFACV